MPDYLFVYGTLRKGYDLKVENQVRDQLHYVGQARVGAALYDLGRYPGAVRSNKGPEVIGDVFLVNDAERVLRVFDKYEGIEARRPDAGEFIRKRSRVRLRSGKLITAWIYWYNFDPMERAPVRYKDYLNYLKKKNTQKES